MKTIVSIQDISEFEIKPQMEVNHWRELVEEEIRQTWSDRSGWINIPCPACTNDAYDAAFERDSISYVECSHCGTLYAPFRPNENQLSKWYRDSIPSGFFRDKILKSSDSARLEKIARPRADWILDRIAEYFPSVKNILDISPHSRTLLDLLVDELPVLLEITASGVSADLEGKTTEKVKVIPTLTSELNKQEASDVIVAIDILNRTADPKLLLKNLEDALSPGGLVFMTATVASGFEIQTLWEKSPSIIPPDKLNLPTIEGLKKYFTDSVWEILELSTPGMFDVEIVYRAMKEEPERNWPRVLRSLVQNSNAIGRTSLVELLQSQQLTSFARLVIKKK